MPQALGTLIDILCLLPNCKSSQEENPMPKAARKAKLKAKAKPTTTKLSRVIALCQSKTGTTLAYCVTR